VIAAPIAATIIVSTPMMTIVPSRRLSLRLCLRSCALSPFSTARFAGVVAIWVTPILALRIGALPMREKSANPKDCNGDESQRASDNSGKDGLTMIARKQDHNAATFVASPFRLPWLETDDEGTLDVGARHG
jgi:hypothetical protein